MWSVRVGRNGQPGWPFVFLYFCVFAFFVFLRGLSSKLLLKGPFIFLLTSLTYILLWHKVCVRRNQPASLYICIFVNKEFNFYIVPKYIYIWNHVCWILFLQWSVHVGSDRPARVTICSIIFVYNVYTYQIFVYIFALGCFSQLKNTGQGKYVVLCRKHCQQ